ncbi:MAG: HAMP domain-containing histidine kinase [Clostridiales bacterium]|nr:HAMP domain-containing histidine kinase [Clostridiales bacterium]
MKKSEATDKLSLKSRMMNYKNSLGIRSRIFLYFLLFTGLLLVLLWLFQIVFLDEFYRLQKTEMLKSSSDSIVRNINNENLQTLVDRIAEDNEVCVLVIDENLKLIVSAEHTPGCIIHHMSIHDILRYTEMAMDENESVLRIFPMLGFRNEKYDEKKFSGHVPSSDDGSARSMVTVKATVLEDGRRAFVFLNATVTPVTATVQTIRNELIFITVILILLSFLISLVLSKRITSPLIATTQAAKQLSIGEYTPVLSSISYREIKELNAQLIQTADDLKRVETMQRELIANISHDLRTPLTLIEGYAEVMRDLPGENTPENMQVIIDETKRLSTLVNAILDYSVSKSGKDVIKNEKFDLTSSINSILERYGKLKEQDGYHIIFEPFKNVCVCADELKVGQVIYNLINNALTYTGADKTVNVVQTVSNGKVKIEIKDSGEGIEPDELDSIWERYYRSNKAHKRAAIGTGLGLNIVKGILDSHGLEYGVESEIKKGSTFWFVLPEA